MKDYKILFGYAAILLSIGFVIRSITFAYAYPTGPSVSMGSNPKFSNVDVTITANGNYQNGTGSTSYRDEVLLQGDSDYDTVITKVIGYKDSNSSCSSTVCLQSLKINGTKVSNIFESNEINLIIKENDTLNVQMSFRNGSVCSVTCRYYVQGYYVHP